jgi:hypothetical protein
MSRFEFVNVYGNVANDDNCTEELKRIGRIIINTDYVITAKPIANKTVDTEDLLYVVELDIKETEFAKGVLITDQTSVEYIVEEPQKKSAIIY